MYFFDGARIMMYRIPGLAMARDSRACAFFIQHPRRHSRLGIEMRDPVVGRNYVSESSHNDIDEDIDIH